MHAICRVPLGNIIIELYVEASGKSNSLKLWIVCFANELWFHVLFTSRFKFLYFWRWCYLAKVDFCASVLQCIMFAAFTVLAVHFLSTGDDENAFPSGCCSIQLEHRALTANNRKETDIQKISFIRHYNRYCDG